MADVRHEIKGFIMETVNVSDIRSVRLWLLLRINNATTILEHKTGWIDQISWPIRTKII